MGPETGALVIRISGLEARARERLGRHRAPGPADARYHPENEVAEHSASRTPASNRFSLVEKPRHRMVR